MKGGIVVEEQGLSTNDMGFDEWLSNLYVQYDKRFFSHGIDESGNKKNIRKFCEKLILYLSYIRRHQLSGIRGTRIRDMISGVGRIKINNSERLPFVFTNYGKTKLLTLGPVVNHSNQNKICDNLGKKVRNAEKNDGALPGMAQRPLKKFLKWVEYLCEHIDSADFRIVDFEQPRLGAERYYVLDEKQKKILKRFHAPYRYTYVIGNAGAGKSTVGNRWLMENVNENVKTLYLTLSGRLVEWYENRIKREFQANQEDGMESFLEIKYMPTFEFLRKCMPLHKEILDPEESYRRFQTVCRQIGSGWECLNGEHQSGKEFIVWREIHGLIEGAINDRNKFLSEKSVEEIEDDLTQDKYPSVRKQHGRNYVAAQDGWNDKQVRFLYRVYKEYRDSLRNTNTLDDNDLARYLLRNIVEVRKYMKELGWTYDAVFVDECQDLTEIQILALSALLDDRKKWLIASDRCQIVRPTYYDTGVMRQIMQRNSEIATPKKDLDLISLNCNYRSSASKAIVDIQNELIDEFTLRKLHNLKDVEREHATLPESAINENEEVLPIWIVETEINKRKLESFVARLGEGRLSVIHANDDTGKLLTIVNCKGMSLLSVLLWNVFGEESGYVAENDSMAWDFFYVGITRAEKYLIIFEKNESPIGEFLDNMVRKGYVQKIINITDGENGILQRMERKLLEITDEERIARADTYLQEEQYYEALNIYRVFQGKPEIDRKIMECNILIAEKEGDYDNFLEIILEAAQKDKNHAKKLARKLRTHSMVPARIIFAIGLLDYGNQNYCDNLYRVIEKLYGDYCALTKEPETMDALIDGLIDKHPALKKHVEGWMRECLDKHTQSIERIVTLTDGKHSWIK